MRGIGGRDLGITTLTVTAQGLSPMVSVSGSFAAQFGIHVHEAGVCDPGGESSFGSAGAHFNPTGMAHGGTPD